MKKTYANLPTHWTDAQVSAFIRAKKKIKIDYVVTDPHAVYATIHIVEEDNDWVFPIGPFPVETPRTTELKQAIKEWKSI